MKKVVSILGLCVLFVGSVEAGNQQQLTVKANVDPVLEITRAGTGDIDLLCEGDTARTATFHTKCNSAAKTKVTLASENAAAAGGKFNVKSGENRIEYTVNPNNSGDLASPGDFEISSGKDVSLVFTPLGERGRYRAGDYADTVTVTITAGEGQDVDDSVFSQGGYPPEEDD